jgi:hypothetical protein
MKTVKMTVIGGSCTIETEGFAGSACLRKTEALRRALGAKDDDVVYTGEFYQQEEDVDELQKT